MSQTFRPGMVLRYPYLWHWQSGNGETEGRKDRPTAVAAVFIGRDDRQYVLLLPLTTKQPSATRIAVEVPTTEKKRAGLDQALRQWIVLDEYNLDPTASSYYLQQTSSIGQFSDAFMRPVLTQFRDLLPTARSISRCP